MSVTKDLPTLDEFKKATYVTFGLRSQDKVITRLDELLTQRAANWSLERMAVTDRNVLRMGAFEIMYSDTPRRVAINEAVELAKRYGAKQSAQFVNGILDRFLPEGREPPAD